MSIPQERLNAVFADAEDHLLNKSVLVGIAPNSMIGLRLHAEPYSEGVKCLVTIEVPRAVDEDETLMETISDAVADHLKQNWDLGRRLKEIGLTADVVDWWPVKFEVV